MELTITMGPLRANAGLTLRTVSSKIDVAESTIRNWEKGRNEPQLRLWQVKTLTELYQCSLDDLVLAVSNSMGATKE